MVSNNNAKLLDHFVIGDDLNWDAPWIDVWLWVELPFWIMVNNTTFPVEVDGHKFQVAIFDNYFELYGGGIADSKNTVIYNGPLKNINDLSDEIKQFHKKNLNVPLMWRKCKTILKIMSRCNEDIWKSAICESGLHEQTVHYYLAELCRVHIPIANKLVQGYRLSTYDYFAFEVSPWDVPLWRVERNAQAVRICIIPYREWDEKPQVIEAPFDEIIKNKISGKKLDFHSASYKLIEGEDLEKSIAASASPGEFELLDSLNLMERGDYSGAVRRITTAIEVIVGAVVRIAVEAKEGAQKADDFLKVTETNFPARIVKYEKFSGRKLPKEHRAELDVTRMLRHRIVHKGYRIGSGERGMAQRAVDTGRWIYNWFENDEERSKVRETRIAFRGLGRDMSFGIFPTKITPDGVVVSPIPR